MSKHLKRYVVPKTWKIKVKEIKYISKPSPGTHKMNMSLPLNVILRDILGYANSNREVKFMLEKKNVTVDGIRRKDYRFPVGLFDVLSLNDVNEHFRVILDKRGKIDLIKIGDNEHMLKLCRVKGKCVVKGKVQLNLDGGRNIIVKEDNYKTGDAVLLDLGKKNEIKQKIGLDKNFLIYLTGGKHIGQTGKVQDIIGNRILYKTEAGDVVEALKKDAFPIGKDKPLISLTGK
jgi:small subunit ribosomal protein S4e|tara:strand:+ start:2236 stop:2931 length:696 start_codon:yes stop_codon:yes gene_type:complete